MSQIKSLFDLLGIRAPDIRAWSAIAAFVLAYKCLDMIDHHSELLKDGAFMGFAGIIVTGGAVGVWNNMFGGTKSSTEMNAALATKVAGTGDGK